MNQLSYYRIKTRMMLANFLIVLFPALVIAIILLLFNISSLKKELRNTMGLNSLLKQTISEQTKDIDGLYDQITEDLETNSTTE